MKNLIPICLCVVIMIGLISCNKAESAISDLEDLTEKVEANYKSYTQEDWENFAASYSAIEEELSKYEYSDEQLKKIGNLKGKCMGYMTKQTLDDFEKQLNDLPKQIEGAIEGFMDVLSNDDEE